MQQRKTYAAVPNDDPSTGEIEKNTSRNVESRMSYSYIKRKVMAILILSAAVFGLVEINFLRVLLGRNMNEQDSATSAHRNWIQVGILCCSIVVWTGWYMEFYRQIYLKQKVNYETARTETHVLLGGLIGAGIALNIGLWPLWGWMTPFYLLMWAYGFLFQIIVVFPPMIQRTLFVMMYLSFVFLYFF